MVHDIIFSLEKPSITTSLIYLYLIFKISTLRLEMKQNSTLPQSPWKFSDGHLQNMLLTSFESHKFFHTIPWLSFYIMNWS